MKKHRWITEAINAGDKVLTVWPSKEDLASKPKMAKFFETVESVGNDPRVVNIRRVEHPDLVVVFLFDIDENFQP